MPNLLSFFLIIVLIAAKTLFKGAYIFRLLSWLYFLWITQPTKTQDRYFQCTKMEMHWCYQRVTASENCILCYDSQMQDHCLPIPSLTSLVSTPANQWFTFLVMHQPRSLPRSRYRVPPWALQTSIVLYECPKNQKCVRDTGSDTSFCQVFIWKSM